MGAQSRVNQILAVVLLAAALGCNPLREIFAKWRTPEAYVPPGSVAELRRPVVVPVWVHDKKTGELKKAYVNAAQGWLVGPDVAQPAKPELK